jgi:mannan endo-1,4-beta-mannosidase
MLTAVALAGCGLMSSASTASKTGAIASDDSPIKYVGMFSTGLASSYSSATSFNQATGAHVNIAAYYSGWGEPFQTQFADRAWQHGALTLVDIDPYSGSANMSAISDGRYDAYLRSLASKVAEFGHPVIISFAHEMNGSWFHYGYKYVAPSVFIAAYRHVHDVFEESGGEKVIWMWTVNIPSAGQTSTSVDEWYPGDSYVDWVGIDGYDWSASRTFTQTFGTTLSQVRGLTNRPVLISETSVLPTSKAAMQVTSWFQGIESDHLLGLVWFDIDKASKTGTTDTHDWRLENDPPALAAFRSAIHAYGQAK